MAKDPYKYFRVEARELLNQLNQSALELDKGGNTKDLVAQILRVAHTLKGAARIVKQNEIAETSHAIEGMFAPFREEVGTIPNQQVNQVLRLLDDIAGRVDALELPIADARKESSTPANNELYESVRVEIEEVDTLLDAVSEASVQLAALRQAASFAPVRKMAEALCESLLRQPDGAEAAQATRIRAHTEELRGRLEGMERSLSPAIDQLEAELTQVREASQRLRLLPASAIFSSLQRAVRDAAQSLNKQVVFESFGGEHRLDAHVLVALRDALLHMVRNSVAHGIESPSERSAAGKSAQGRVELRVERRGSRLAFVCRDDGRGIDVEAIRQAAVQRGLVAPAAANSLALQEAVALIMAGGLTTTRVVDQVSGRGIGLDVVRETVTRLRGQLTMSSEFRSGTSMEICVPVSVSSLTALQVDAAGTIVSLPLYAVRQVLRIAETDIVRSGGKESIVHDGKVIPFLPLSMVLHRKPVARKKRQIWSAVVLESSSGLAAIGVDCLLGASTILVRPLPSLTPADPIIAGAALSAEGSPQPVLNIERLIVVAGLERASAGEAVQTHRPSILVIDDSLTTRMLEQNILESAGYQVEIATSAEEGLGKARQKEYGLFLVDVEMPGMSGFQFVSTIQSDALLHKVPAILVSSLNSPQDLQRGKDVGAHAYIVKGEFDQGELLQRVRECIG